MGKSHEKHFERQGADSEIRDPNQSGDIIRSLLITKSSENSEVTAETSRTIIPEISWRLSRKLEEIRIELYSHILEVITSAIEEKVLRAFKLRWENEM